MYLKILKFNQELTRKQYMIFFFLEGATCEFGYVKGVWLALCYV